MCLYVCMCRYCWYLSISIYMSILAHIFNICEYCVYQSISVHMSISAHMFVSANIVDIRQYLTVSDLRVSKWQQQAANHSKVSPSHCAPCPSQVQCIIHICAYAVNIHPYQTYISAYMLISTNICAYLFISRNFNLRENPLIFRKKNFGFKSVLKTGGPVRSSKIEKFPCPHPESIPGPSSAMQPP